MLIYKNGVYRNCTDAMYQSKFKSLGYGAVKPLPEKVLPVKEETAEITTETEPEKPMVPRPKARPKRGKK